MKSEAQQAIWRWTLAQADWWISLISKQAQATTEPSAVAPDAATQVECLIRSLPLPVLNLSPAKAGSGFLGDVIPGLRSLRSLTRAIIYRRSAAR